MVKRQKTQPPLFRSVFPLLAKRVAFASSDEDVHGQLINETEHGCVESGLIRRGSPRYTVVVERKTHHVLRIQQTHLYIRGPALHTVW